MRRPSYQFYPLDWLGDQGLRACCLAPRGLWVDMLSFMHQGNPYGHLTFGTSDRDGKDGDKDTLRPILPRDLARMVGTTVEEIAPLLDELEAHNVFSRTPNDVIFSRRMVRDEELRRVRANGGIESLKNPKVPRPKNAAQAPERIEERTSLEPSLHPSFGGSPSSSSSPSSSMTKPKPSSKADALQGDADSRHGVVRSLIQQLHQEKFHVSVQWDGSEGRALTKVLAANPGWTAAQLETMARNRFASEVAADRPRAWLPILGTYAAGPLDRYGKPKGESGPKNNLPSMLQDYELAPSYLAEVTR